MHAVYTKLSLYLSNWTPRYRIDEFLLIASYIGATVGRFQVPQVR